MILFENVSKAYKVHRHMKPVFNNLNSQIDRGDAIGICGANGAGKSLMRMLAGVEPQTGGRIVRTMSTSWPIGFTSAFQMGLTGADNARFYDRDKVTSAGFENASGKFVDPGYVIGCCAALTFAGLLMTRRIRAKVHG